MLSGSYFGRVHRSTDAGDTWSNTYDISGVYRIYDFVEIGSRWWVITTNTGDSAPRVRYSDNSGSTWNVLSTTAAELPDRLQRFMVIGTDLYYVNNSKNRIYKVTSGLAMSYLNLLGREWGYPEFNGLTHDGSNFYWADLHGYIWKVDGSWTTVQQHSYVPNAISLYYWPDDEALIASDKGTSPNLWRITLS